MRNVHFRYCLPVGVRVGFAIVVGLSGAVAHGQSPFSGTLRKGDSAALQSFLHAASGAHSRAGGVVVPSASSLQNMSFSRTVHVPKPGQHSPNASAAVHQESGPVFVDNDITPVELSFGTGATELRRRGKPLLYGIRNRSQTGNILIPESSYQNSPNRTSFGGEVATDEDGGGADMAAPGVFGAGSSGGGRKDAGNPEKEVSAARVNAVAFGSSVERADLSKVYVAPKTVPTVLGTAEFHRFMGHNFRADSRWADCVEEYNAVLQLEPCDALARVCRGEALWQLDRKDEAKSDFNSVVGSGVAEVRFIRANWLRETGKNDAAIAEYKVALRLGNGKDARVLNNLGVAYMNANKLDEAQQTFAKALESDPVYGKSLVNAGILHDDLLGDSQGAIAYYERYLATSDRTRRGEVSRWLQEAKKSAGE